jgi:hypothetical protein
MFHDMGLTHQHSTAQERFEVDSANTARDFLRMPLRLATFFPGLHLVSNGAGPFNVVPLGFVQFRLGFRDGSAASSRADLAHPSIVRNAGRRSVITDMEFAPAQMLGPSAVPAANTKLGFEIVGTRAFPPIPPPW